jgi:hypothetical protein
MAEAHRIVDKHWATIERLADALFERGSLDENEINQLTRNIRPADGILLRKGYIDGLQTRRGLTSPRGFDPTTREVDAVISTGARVRRRDWDGEYDEVLDMKPSSVRVARLNQGAASLDPHRGLDAMLGGVVPGSARLENGELVARIRFSRGSALAQRVAQDLQDRVQIPLSAGYRVHRSVDDHTTSPVTRRAVDWNRSRFPW